MHEKNVGTTKSIPPMATTTNDKAHIEFIWLSSLIDDKSVIRSIKFEDKKRVFPAFHLTSHITSCHDTALAEYQLSA